MVAFHPEGEEGLVIAEQVTDCIVVLLGLGHICSMVEGQLGEHCMATVL